MKKGIVSKLATVFAIGISLASSAFAQQESGDQVVSKQLNGVIHLNTVTPRQLANATGIPVTQAVLITEYRIMIGKFTSIDQLYDVPELRSDVIEQLRSDAGIEL